MTIIPPGLLHRYFKKSDHGYRISKQIGQMCIFARQDLTRRPPISKADLISCRNVLVYFEEALRKQTLLKLHYALKPGGYLWLGPDESIAASHLFAPVDKVHPIYKTKPAADSSPL